MARKTTERLIRKDDPDYNVIGSYISSAESVVGIDARHTHIIIIKKLVQLEKKLRKLDKRLRAMGTTARKKKSH